MAKTLQAVRGMRDLLPPDTSRWQQVEATARAVLAGFGYEEIRLPVMEFTELFARGVGEATDIVEKEMYSFRDRGDDSLTLRPEGTAGCVRACLEHGLLHNQTQRLWYAGPMFRYERPQKGRYRQFDQIGVEAFGIVTPDLDAELLQITAALWQALGVADHVRLELNTLGDADSRARYRAALVAYLEQHRDALDADSQRRLGSNPLRILDSKDAGTRAVLADAPLLTDHLDPEAAEHFAGVQGLLDDMGIAYRVNPAIVRGLDYYNRTVFEWITDSLGAQGTVCGGGRYDGLVPQLGGRPTPAAGFAMGIDRLVLLKEAVAAAALPPAADAYVAVLSPACQGQAMVLAQQLRERVPGARVRVHLGGGKLKNQMKRADQSGARVALVLGEDELAAGVVGVKPLRDQREQQQLDLAGVAAFLAAELASTDNPTGAVDP